MRIHLATAVVCCLMVAGTVFAQQQQRGLGGPGPGMGGPSAGPASPGTGRGPGMGTPGMGPGAQQGNLGQLGYRGIDRNGDGIIARDELTEHQRLLDQLQDNWEQADRDRDGQVNAEEFAAFERSQQQQ